MKVLGNGEYAPHISLALLYNDTLDYFMDDRTLRRLDGIAEVGGEVIALSPSPDGRKLHLPDPVAG